ncbi:hypothetical protein NPIL_582281 [Nephila pilipes]|uniref:Uncharacterized protein n=1 Tax=Nephila pilipes TaxID=299642 RepID=A0A8X6N918_NEPPI|nr:hypothetical protein NPIL_582281 [Nephila pilipes]
MSPPVLTSYIKADWASDTYTRSSSTIKNVFLIGNNPISWFSKKQNCIVLPSRESEYIAAAQAAQEIRWLILLLKDLRMEQHQLTGPTGPRSTSCASFLHKLQKVIQESNT